jgi:hypothetical protein
MKLTIIHATAARNGILGNSKSGVQNLSFLQNIEKAMNAVISATPMYPPTMSARATFTPMGGVGKM